MKLTKTQKSYAYMLRREREENASDGRGFDPNDIRLVSYWIRKAWLDGYSAALRSNKAERSTR